MFYNYLQSSSDLSSNNLICTNSLESQAVSKPVHRFAELVAPPASRHMDFGRPTHWQSP